MSGTKDSSLAPWVGLTVMNVWVGAGLVVVFGALWPATDGDMVAIRFVPVGGLAGLVLSLGVSIGSSRKPDAQARWIGAFWTALPGALVGALAGYCAAYVPVLMLRQGWLPFAGGVGFSLAGAYIGYRVAPGICRLAQQVPGPAEVVDTYQPPAPALREGTDAVGRDQSSEGLSAPDYRRWVIGLTALGAVLGFAAGGIGSWLALVFDALAGLFERSSSVLVMGGLVGGLIGGWIGNRTGRALGVCPISDRAWILTVASDGAIIGAIMGGLVGLPVGFLISPQYEMIPLGFAIVGALEGALLGGLAGAFVGGYRGSNIAAERRSMAEPPPLPPLRQRRDRPVVVVGLVAVALALRALDRRYLVVTIVALAIYWFASHAFAVAHRRWMRERR